MTLLWLIGLTLFGGTVTSTPYRIVGGYPTTVEKFPSIIQVESLSYFDKWSHSCGGSILTNLYVLSAANCFKEGRSIAPFRRIRAGATYRNNGGKLIYVARVINHPKYNPHCKSSIENDISVIQLMLPLPSANNIQRAPIPVHGTVVPDNLPVVLAGWGDVSVLHKVTVYTINNRLCAERYRELNSSLEITENIICAGILEIDSQDKSYYDAGGPMYYNGIVIGVISTGDCCKNAILPAIHTSVGAYTDWIAANVA